jgi:putative transposase
VQGELKISERRACRVICQPRSTRRYVGLKAGKDLPLLKAHSFALPREPSLRLPPGMGALEAGRLARHQEKRVHRLWRERGLKVPVKQHKRRRLSDDSENGCARQRAEYKDHVWSHNFVMDRTDDGDRLKMLPIREQALPFSTNLSEQSKPAL